MKHNNILTNVHFHKDWKIRVKTWFNQPGRKQTRRRKRAEKAAKIFPRPLRSLKPIVQCQTIRYNAKSKLGRGFTFAELKAAEINPIFARTIGISVDHRRGNPSEETFTRNVNRLKEYKSKLILFPRNPAKVKKGEATAEETKAATQVTGDVLPIVAKRLRSEKRALTDAEKNPKRSVYQQLRVARSIQRLAGVKKKKAAAKANALPAAGGN